MYLGPAIAIPQPITPLWSVVTPPSALPVDLDIIKTYINRPLEDTFWDDETTGFIRIAQSAIEQRCQLVLSQTTFMATLPALYDRVLLKKRPFVSVTKIEYVDPITGVITTIDPTTYVALPATQLCGMVYLGDGVTWPQTATRADAVRITMTAGWTTDTLPSDVDHALKMTVAAIDRNRGDQGSGHQSHVTVYAMKNTRATSIIPNEAQALLAPYTLRTV